MDVRVPVVLAVLLLAGCSGDPAPADLPPEANPEGAVPVTADAQVAAPAWVAGDWWTYRPTFSDGSTGDPLTAVVTDVTGDSYSVAAANEMSAKVEAAYGHPLLGDIRRADLGMRGWQEDETPWSLLAFPLADGKQWSSTMPNIAWDVVEAATADLEMVATFDAELGDGQGGYRIVGSWQGTPTVEAEYVPAIGWFTALQFNDIDPEQDPLEIRFDLTASGSNHTGERFVAAAESLLFYQDANGFSDDPTQGGTLITDAPNPMMQFTMTGGAGSSLFGFVFAQTVFGGRVVELVDPAGQRTEILLPPSAAGGQGIGIDIDQPGVTGQWTLASAGAGAFTFTLAQLFEVTVAPVA